MVFNLKPLIRKDLKELALWLLDHNYIPVDVSEIFGVSERSLQRWKTNQAQYGLVLPPPPVLQGRPRILNTDRTHDLFILLEEAPEMFLGEIQDWLALTYNTGISRITLHENIRDCGLTYKMLRRAAAGRNDDLREEWMDVMRMHHIARQLVIVDETSKDDRTIYRHYGPATIHANFGGERYNMLAALSMDGYEAVSVIQGSVDEDAFFEFIVKDVLPKMNQYPQDNSVLVLDNHDSKILREIIEAHGQILVLLPPYSPDYNPIEESFSCVKSWIRHNWACIQNSEYPEIALLEAANAVTPEKAREWFLHSGYNVTVA